MLLVSIKIIRTPENLGGVILFAQVCHLSYCPCREKLLKFPAALF
jgi:hypothetical protein